MTDSGGYTKTMKLLAKLLTLTTQKDDSPEAGLSGDLDELPEDEKVEEPVPIDEVTEED